MPKKIGEWILTRVYVRTTYPDMTQREVQCVLTGGVWVGTFQGSSLSGKVTNGYVVYADGTTERGNDVVGYVLGKGDVYVMNEDGSITPGEVGHVMSLVSPKPVSPKIGDVCFEDGLMKTWNGTVWMQSVSKTSQLENDSGFITGGDIPTKTS